MTENEAGPSRLRSTAPTKNPEGTIDDQYLREFASTLNLPITALPRRKIHGTESFVTDLFAPSALAEIHDAELLHDLPSLFPTSSNFFPEWLS